MGWFSKILYKAVEQEQQKQQGGNIKMAELGVPEERNKFGKEMQISIYKATGGHIVKFPRWDHTRDEDQSSVYIITEEEDFTECLSKLITAERMKG